MKSINILMAIALAVVVAFSGCGGKSDKTIRLNEVTHSIFYAPLYIAINNGYFEDEGLKIELTNGGGSDKSMTALISGQADIALLGPETAIYVAAQNSKDQPIIFGQLTKRDGTILVGRTQETNFSWADLEGKEILGGRRGGMPAMTLEYVLKKQNVRDKMTLNLDIAFDMMVSAFENGQGDYCTMFEPTASDYISAGKGYKVASIGQESGEVPYTAFMATSKFLKDKPEKGWNVMLMRSVDLKGNLISYAPHMAVIFVNDDNSISLAHYTGGKEMKSDDWSQKGIENDGSDSRGGFRYSSFSYYPIKEKKK